MEGVGAGLQIVIIGKTLGSIRVLPACIEALQPVGILVPLRIGILQCRELDTEVIALIVQDYLIRKPGRQAGYLRTLFVREGFPGLVVYFYIRNDNRERE